MVKKILIGLVGLVVLLAALGFVLPDARHVERAIVINAPAETVYALVADLGKTDQWQPWSKMDPELTQEISGSGIGQKQVWKSKELGDGSQEIVGLNPPTGVDYRLDFGDMGRAVAAIRLEPVEGGVKATWSLDTKMREGVPFYMQPVSTYMGFFMDQMVGKDYEKGLAELKRLAEAS